MGVRSGRYALLIAVLLGLGACKLPQSGAKGALVYDAKIAGAAPESVDVVMATEVEILTSRRVLIDAVQGIHLHEMESFQCTEQEAADRIEKWITVERRGQSTVIDVTVTHEDFKLAQDVCNEVMRAYVESHMDEKRAEIAFMQDKGMEVGLALYKNEVKVLDYCEIVTPG